jgi:hypothetical protein
MPSRVDASRSTDGPPYRSCVVDEVAECLLEADPVPAESHPRLSGDGHRLSQLGRAPLEAGHDRGEQIAGLEVLQAERYLSAVAAGDQEQAFGELRRSLRLV